MADDILDEIDDIMDETLDAGSGDEIMQQITDETNDVRVEFLGYNRNANGTSTADPEHQELVCFSIENLSSEPIEIWSDEFTVTGDDAFVYNYVEKPWRSLSDFPSHFVDERGYDIPSGSKVRYLILSEAIPSSVSIQKIDYLFNSISFTLEIPDDMPDKVGNPPF